MKFNHLLTNNDQRIFKVSTSTSKFYYLTRRLAQLVYLTTDHASLGSGTGSGCHATWGFDPITVYAAAGSGPNFDPSTGHALGSSRCSNPITDHVALGSGTGSDCHTT